MIRGRREERVCLGVEKEFQTTTSKRVRSILVWVLRTEKVTRKQAATTATRKVMRL